MNQDKGHSGESASHTPGPWTFRRDENTYTAHSIFCGEYELAATTGWQVNKEIDAANAALIAAAPDLLAALIEAKEMLRMAESADNAHWGYRPVIEQAEAAIAKAKGVQ